MSTSLQSYEFGSSVRRSIFMVIVLLIGLIYTGRLIQLQIIQGSDYRTKSETQAIKQLVVEPVRGSLFDRNGKLIVNNAPSFLITITPKDFNNSILPYLAKLLGVEEKDITDKLSRYRLSPFTPVTIMRDVDPSIIAALEENHEYLPGVEIKSDSKRLYNFQGNAAHLFGYTKEISEKQLDYMGDYYHPGDIIGASGLEASYENFLRGTKGIEFSAVNAVGQHVARFNNGKNDINAEDGFDLRLGIDIDLQDYAEELMDGRRGAVVAMDPNNGEILALVSKPDYDIRQFSGRTPSNLYTDLLEDEAKPLFNRATLTRYPPGSTWKPMMAAACLQEGVINENTVLVCPGTFTYGGRVFHCHAGHAHGAVNVRKAIHVSCNVFFYQMALRLGITNFTKYGEMFGFGQKTGLDIGNNYNEETTGLLPSTEIFNKMYGPKGWTVGRLVNLGIGQGELGVSPLQMAAYVSTIANKGTWRQPHVVRSVFNKKLGKMAPIDYASRELPIDKKYFDLIRLAMYDVVNTPGGTAAAARMPDVAVCGKTGTAQNPHGKDHAWFICFAPMDHPKIAMCVMVENAGLGGAISAPIAQKLLTKFFHPELHPDKPDTTNLVGVEPD